MTHIRGLITLLITAHEPPSTPRTPPMALWTAESQDCSNRLLEAKQAQKEAKKGASGLGFRGLGFRV